MREQPCKHLFLRKNAYLCGMEFNRSNVILKDNLNDVFSPGMEFYITHAYACNGSCEIIFNNESFDFSKGDMLILMSNRLVNDIKPSSDFKVKVIYIQLQYMETCTPHTSYGVKGGLSMFINPVIPLSTDEQAVIERDFDEIARRYSMTYDHFHGDVMMTVVQTLFIDLYETHARHTKDTDISALTASIMRKFITMLENGDYKKNREVSYYADALCVTPKYLSELCKKVSGYSANFWINRFTTIELSRLLKDKSLQFTDIADMFNFSSQSHFSRYVERYLGAYPSVFRN